MKDLEQIFSKDQIKTDEESLKYYGRDWTTYYDIKATAIVFPTSTEQVQKLVLWARKNKVALVPSGGRTGLSGGAVATKGEVVVSFEKMNQILNYDASEPSLLVQAGAITEQIQDFAKEKGQFYPVDFAARGSSHIGGNIATNAGGIKVLRYGLTRDWVLGMKVVTGTGEILELNKGLIKNATGLDLRQLFIGSEGILGFVTEATLKLHSAPPPQKVLLLALASLEAVMPVFSNLRSQVTLTAFEMFSEAALKKVLESTGLPRPLDSESPFYVVAEFESRSDSDDEKAMAAFEKSVEEGLVLDGNMSQNETQSKTFWRYREDISESLAKYSPYKNDISVRVSSVTKFLSELSIILEKAYPTWEVIWFGHIGDGNLHINILRPPEMKKEEFVKECRKVDLLIFETVKKYQGAISAEHGVGLSKKDFLTYTRSTEEIALMKLMKKNFDPDNIMNPGKVFDLP
jgi:glycolate oxidase subunit GlcD